MLLGLSVSVMAIAQPKILTQAMVITKTTIVAPENDELPVPAYNESGEQLRIIRFGGEGETKTTTWLKNDLIKTFSESEMGRTTVIRDHSKKITTTIMEMMGKKSGFFATDEDQMQMRKQMDSMMRSRGQTASDPGLNTPPVYAITYIDENKNIAGFNCKKAFVIGTRSNGKSDTTIVWYCPDFKIQNLPSTGGSGGGFGGFNVTSATNGMEDLAGFPLQYERNMNRGRKMTVQVTKIVNDKDVSDKEFEIPKGIDVKPMKDMQTAGGPGMQIRIGGQ